MPQWRQPEGRGNSTAGQHASSHATPRWQYLRVRKVLEYVVELYLHCKEVSTCKHSTMLQHEQSTRPSHSWQPRARRRVYWRAGRTSLCSFGKGAGTWSSLLMSKKSLM